MDLTPIHQAMRQAAMLCREVQHNYLFSNNKFSPDKSATEPVTIADYGSQAIICHAIQAHFPDDAVIAEEAGKQFLELVTGEQRAQIIRLLTTVLDKNITQHDVIHWLDHGNDTHADRTWVIDPIDGTKGFINLRHYVIAVGVLEGGKPVDGIIAAPAYGDGVSGYDEDGALFYTQGGQAFREPLSGGTANRLSVSNRTDPADIRILQSFEKQHASKERMARVRELAGMSDTRVHEMDSMEKYALVAAGEADFYLRLPNRKSKRPHMVWDHAAGTALVEAAGGRVSDVDGQPLDFSQGSILPNRGMIVSNGALHDQLVNATQTLLREEAAEATE